MGVKIGTEVKCLICEKKIKAASPTHRFCSSKCQKKHRRKVEKEKAKELDKEAKTPKKVYKAKNSNSDLSKLNREAFPLGLSYGQYVAMIECGARYELKRKE